MDLKFRELYAYEIEIKPTVYDDVVKLALYKDARCDQRILDETVKPMNWQKKYSRNNMNCTVSIWDNDKNQWVEKEDTGTATSDYEEKEKALASDSFKRACFVWGIGRALYTAKALDLQFTAKELGNLFNTNEKKVYATFKVNDIKYEDDQIKSIIIAVCQKGEILIQKRFTKDKPPVLKYSENKK